MLRVAGPPHAGGAGATMGSWASGWTAVGLGAVVLSTGCAHVANSVDTDEEAPAFRLGREDVVEVSVYRDPELTRTVPVRPDGRISLPIVGELEAAGRTPDEVRREVVLRLQAYVQDPTVVSVIVREVNSARIYVLGEVGRPGVYPLRGEVSVLQALALAGGPGEFSARDLVTVVRAGSGRRLTLALGELEDGRLRVRLLPGDTVVVR